MVDWEIYFRELASRSGLAQGLTDTRDPPDNAAVDAFCGFAERFADLWRHRPSPRLWCMEYETALFTPLARASFWPSHKERASAVYQKVLGALDEPVARDLEALRSFMEQNPDTEQLTTFRLKSALNYRSAAVSMFARGPHFKMIDSFVDVRLVDRASGVELDKAGKEANHP